MIYCIDTQTFIWGVKKQADDHDKHRLDEARRLMDWMKKGKHQVIVPTVVLAEALIREPEELHAPIISEAYKRFIVADFDGRCALKYGELLRLDKWEDAKETARVNNIRREKMKLDHMIVSCALVHGANGIFSTDPDVIKFANGLINVHSPNIIPVQAELFELFSP